MWWQRLNNAPSLTAWQRYILICSFVWGKKTKDKKLGLGTSVGKKSVSSKTNAIHHPL